MTPTGARLLIADDEPGILSLLKRILSAEGHEVQTAPGGLAAIDLARREQPHLMLVDLTMPDRSGLDVLKAVRESSPETKVIIMTAYASAETAVEAMKLGALDYLIKPIATDELKLQVGRALNELALVRENRSLRDALQRAAPEDTMIGESPALRRVLGEAEQIGASDSTVLIEGETGTGKELVARLLHRVGDGRRRGPFLAVNCGALTEALLERELFGHEKGAFTGADQPGPGLLEAAGDGTLFLDEIGEMSATLQVKLLRVLEGREFMRVGGTRPLTCRARFIAATNKNLSSEVKNGKFRQDLFYRLNVLTLRLPALRERDGDVGLIAEWLLRRFAARRGKPDLALTESAREALARYDWPGNVRELRNVIERAVMLSKGTTIDAGELNLESSAGPGTTMLDAWCMLPHQEAKDTFERWYLAKALKTGGGNITKTAERFGLDRKNLEDKIRKYGLKNPD